MTQRCAGRLRHAVHQTVNKVAATGETSRSGRAILQLVAAAKKMPTPGPTKVSLCWAVDSTTAAWLAREKGGLFYLRAR